jgi:hypothetical protein
LGSGVIGEEKIGFAAWKTSADAELRLKSGAFTHYHNVLLLRICENCGSFDSIEQAMKTSIVSFCFGVPCRGDNTDFGIMTHKSYNNQFRFIY